MGGQNNVSDKTLCQICIQSLQKNPGVATYQCLTCRNQVMCTQCKGKHKANHRMVSYLTPQEEDKLLSDQGEVLSGLQSNNLNCPDHKYNVYSIYCHSCNAPICEKCQNLAPPPLGEKIDTKTMESGEEPKYGHKGHYLRSLDEVLKKCLSEKQKLKKDVKEQFSKIDAALEFFEGIEELNLKQKNLYLQKLAADFEVIRKLVERKHIELKDKIETVYDENLRLAYRYIDGLTSYKGVVTKVQDVGNSNRLDVDQLEVNRVIDRQLKEIQTEFDFDLQTAELDLIESRFIHEPFQKVEKALLLYDFVPIQQQDIFELQQQFVLGGSRILAPDHITVDFMLQIMPTLNDKRASKVELLYSHSALQDPDAVAFHGACDEQGPTLTIVSANGGYIFGGYNPTSWVSDFMYTETDQSYLFQIFSPLSHMDPNFKDQISLAQTIELS